MTTLRHAEHGTFHLHFDPTDKDKALVAVAGEEAVVVYYAVDECPLDPFDDDEGLGKIYRSRDNAENVQEAFALDDEWKPDATLLPYEKQAEVFQSVLRKALALALETTTEDETLIIEFLQTEVDREGEVSGIVTVKGQAHAFFFQPFYERLIVYCDENEDDVQHTERLTAALNEAEEQAWMIARQAGTIGEKWAKPLTSNEYTVRVMPSKCPFVLTGNVRGVWVPSKFEVDEIEALPEAERNEKCTALAQSDCKVYDAYTNGNVYVVIVDMFKRVYRKEGEDFVAAGWMLDDYETCGGYLDDDIEAGMQDALRYWRKQYDPSFTQEASGEGSN